MTAGRAAIVLLAGLGLAACAQFQPAKSYVNPVLDSDFADPAVLRAPDGLFYAYATQGAPANRMFNIQVARSADLVEWTHLGDALPVKPGWAQGKQNFWAPHVIHDAAQGKFFMYYSAEPDAATGKCLAVATAAQPAGPFTDSGRPLLCGEGIEHIDPMAFDDPRSGKLLLYWGSGSKPIKAQELAHHRLAFQPGSAPRDLIFPDPLREYLTLVEAPWVVFRQGSYYLFYSGDRCCARAPRYAVMVARSQDPLGPFEPFAQGPQSAQSVILERGERWLAPGHNCVVMDDEGRDWILYHAVDTTRPQAGREMLLDPIFYRDGWPRIEGGQPSSSSRTAPGLTRLGASAGKRAKLWQ